MRSMTNVTRTLAIGAESETTDIKRGDIFYVEKHTTTGCEQSGGRPAIIVSNDKCNEHSPVVEVVYLTTAPKKKTLPTHVKVNSMPRPSTALCEQITSVAKMRLRDFCGSVTTTEIRQIDAALMVSLGIRDVVHDSRMEEPAVLDLTQHLAAFKAEYERQLTALTAERDIYKQLHSELMDELLGRASQAVMDKECLENVQGVAVVATTRQRGYGVRKTVRRGDRRRRVK